MKDILTSVPVWIVLFLLLGLALARIWNVKEVKGRRHMWFFTFCTQLLLLILWLILFVSLGSLTLASIDAILLWFAVVVLTLDSWEIDRISFWLLLPYLAWVTFALIFNITIWWVN